MSLPLTAEQQSALDAHPGRPLRLIDERTKIEYLLIPADEGNYALSDTYAAQSASAGRAGWDDPIMDEYDNYDENLRKRRANPG